MEALAAWAAQLGRPVDQEKRAPCCAREAARLGRLCARGMGAEAQRCSLMRSRAWGRERHARCREWEARVPREMAAGAQRVVGLPLVVCGPRRLGRKHGGAGFYPLERRPHVREASEPFRTWEAAAAAVWCAGARSVWGWLP